MEFIEGRRAPPAFKNLIWVVMQNDCIFCKIISKEIPTKIVDENEDVLVIQDINPKAPIHYLILPKKHIQSIAQLESSDSQYVAKMMLMARKLADQTLKSDSFRLIMNNGAAAGQTVFHLHCHFLSGKKMSDF